MLEDSESHQRRAGHALHRDVAPGISAALLELGLLQRERPDELARAAPPALERAVSALRGSAAALQSVELSLRPPLLDEAGLVAPLRWLAGNLGVAVELPDPFPRLDPALEWQLYRAIAGLLASLRGRRRLTATASPLVVRVEGRPTPILSDAVADARARLRGQARVLAGPPVTLRAFRMKARPPRSSRK